MKQTALVSVILALLLAGTGASGREAVSDRPAITKVHLFLHDGMVMGDVTSAGLFPERVTGTIQSGLPSVVELFYRLVTRKHDTMGRGMRVYELRYDVWEDRYSVRSDDSTRIFVSLESMTRAVEHLRALALVPVADIDGNGEYAVEFSIAVHPLRSIEKQRIAGWVGEQVRGEGDPSWHENVLNLNQLIAHFFSRNKEGEDRSGWYRTEFFNPRLLVPDDGEVR